MYYVVVEHEVYVFFSYADGKKFYDEADAQGLEPFATQNEDLARFIQKSNITEDYLRGVR